MVGRALRLSLAAAVLASGFALAGCTGAESPTTGGPSGSATSSARPDVDARGSMPVVSSEALGNIGYTKATAKDKKTFAPVAEASSDLLKAPTIQTLTVSGREVGTVAVYAVKSGVAADSARFQDQFIVQLINAVAKSKSAPTFVKTDSQVMALSTGDKAVAGWFDNNRVVLVYRQDKQPDLTELALGVQASPPKA
jgi:hypothetical protein